VDLLSPCQRLHFDLEHRAAPGLAKPFRSILVGKSYRRNSKTGHIAGRQRILPHDVTPENVTVPTAITPSQPTTCPKGSKSEIKIKPCRIDQISVPPRPSGRSAAFQTLGAAARISE